MTEKKPKVCTGCDKRHTIKGTVWVFTNGDCFKFTCDEGSKKVDREEYTPIIIG